MADWRDEAKAPPDDWRSEIEGGAEGGGGSDATPSKRAIKPEQLPEAPSQAELDARQAEDRRQMAGAISGMTGGQNVASLPPEKQEEFSDKQTAGALGEGIALARGAPFVGSHLDELSALLQTGRASGPEYKAKRNEARGAVNQSVANNPALPLVGGLALTPAMLETAFGRLATNGAAGLSEGIGDAPEAKDIPNGAARGLGLGLGAGLAGEAAIAGGRAAGNKLDSVVKSTRDKAQQSAEKAFASARGAHGAEIAAGNRTLEVIERAASDASLPAEMRSKAAEWLKTPEATALKQQVLTSNMGRGEDQLARIARTREAMSDVGLGLAPEAVESSAQARMNDPSALLRRVREFGPKVLLPAVGGALAGPAGAAAGGLSSAVLGRSATTVRNALADPYVATRVLGGAKAAGNAAGRAINAASPTVDREALEKYFESMQQNEDPTDDTWSKLVAGGGK